MSCDERMLQSLFTCHSLLWVNDEAPSNEICQMTLFLINFLQYLLVSHLSRELWAFIFTRAPIPLFRHEDLLDHR